MKLPEITVNKEKSITLRNIERSDVPEMFEYTSDDKVTEFLSFQTHKTVKETEESFDNFFKPMIESEKSGAFAICINNKLIGVIDFRNQENGDIVIGYVLTRKFWGHGIMTDVFKAVTKFLSNEFANSNILVGHHESNIGSQRVIEKNGYKYYESRREELKGMEITTKWYRLKRDNKCA